MSDYLLLIEDGSLYGAKSIEVSPHGFYVEYFDRDKRVIGHQPIVREYKRESEAVKQDTNPFQEPIPMEMTPLEEEAFEELRLSQMMIDSPLEYEKEMMRQFTGRNNND